MPRLVTKFKYMKPGTGKSVGGYAKYIATREGVDKIDNSHKNDPATQAQQKLIKRLLKDFPDAGQSHEYADFLSRPTKGNATEFISRAIEENMDAIADTRTYADYIATRPRAERFGSHGLFTDEGEAVHLTKVSDDLNQYQGNIYTMIVSLRREDAERLGYNTGIRWRDLLRGHTDTIATNMKIPMSHLKWYAAFHNEGHHPHIHLIAYSTVPGEGYLSQQGIEQIRSTLAKDMFAQDMLCTYQQQTEYRDELRQSSREKIAQIVEQINLGNCNAPELQVQLIRLADKLAKTSGKKVYGYLKPEVKAMVDDIVAKLAKDEKISKLYDLWYEQREDVLRTYTDTFPERIPLESNKEFKAIRNAVIQEAMKITQDDSLSGYAKIEPLPESEVEDVSEEKLHEEQQQETPLRTTVKPTAADSKPEDPQPTKDRIKELVQQAEAGSSYAAYQLGKIYYFGMNVPRNIEQGMLWLYRSVEFGNDYAKSLLQSIQRYVQTSTVHASVSLLRSLARLIQSKADDQQTKPKQGIDRKLKREIDEKKQAMGIRD